jgi:hypothetical protein
MLNFIILITAIIINIYFAYKINMQGFHNNLKIIKYKNNFGNGYDERYSCNITDDLLISKIFDNIKRYEIKKYLENNNIDTHSKLKMIQENNDLIYNKSKYTSNLWNNLDINNF